MMRIKLLGALGLFALCNLVSACMFCQPGVVQECVYLQGKCKGKPTQQCDKDGQWSACTCPDEAPAATGAKAAK